MKVTLSRKTPLEVYDVVTRMRVSTSNPGLQYLCSIASKNGGKISEQDIRDQLDMDVSSAKMLHRNGRLFGCWDTEGNLTDEGKMVKATGEALIDERGDFRLWLLSDPTQLFSPQLLHFEHLPEVPPDTKGKPSRSGAPFQEIMKQKETHTSVVQENKRFILKWDGKSASKHSAKFSTGAALKWVWSGEISLESERSVLVEGEICGLKGGKEYSLRGMKFPVGKSGDPNAMLSKWLSTGSFAGESWDSGNFALRRSFGALEEEEKVRYTMNKTLRGKEIGGDWEVVVLSDVPLVAKNERDAKKWALYLLENSLTRYMRTADLSDELEGVLSDSPFRSITNISNLHKSITADIRNTASENRRAFWLTQASDDLESSAHVTVAQSLKTKNENILEWEGGRTATQMMRAFTAGMNGKVSKILYCDQFIKNQEHATKLKSFVLAMDELGIQCGIDVLTVFAPNSKKNTPEEARQMLQEKSSEVEKKREMIQASCGGTVTFQEELWREGLHPVHDRILIVQTDKGEQKTWGGKIGIISNQKIIRYSKTELLEEMLQEWINEVVGDE
jgi:hypothetical protein